VLNSKLLNIRCSYGALDVRRKLAARESTAILKAWLYQHIKNPYPTKAEKILLAIITQMTLTQISTWYIVIYLRLRKLTINEPLKMFN